MAVINILSPHVADLIAAGEVVERPASVIKELVENSFDAGAKNITVEIRGGGATYIRVTDDGCGMAPEDAGIAFLRHATSKLKDEHGLESIGTMGFRGEALAAISSVSNIDLTTRLRGADAGTQMHLAAGDITDMSAAGCPDGTTIIIRDLFFNTPARLKFLKSDRAEASACQQAAMRCALGRPDVSVRYIRDGQEEFFSPGDGRTDSVIYTLLGRDIAVDMLPCSGDNTGMTVEGFISSPSAGRGNRSQQYFFCNGRFIKSQLLQAAVEQAYKNTLLTGRYPACVLYIKIGTSQVDVNVHPAKTEVKFTDEKLVFDLVYYGALSALGSENRTGSAGTAHSQLSVSAGKNTLSSANSGNSAQTHETVQSVKNSSSKQPSQSSAAVPSPRADFYRNMSANEFRANNYSVSSDVRKPSASVSSSAGSAHTPLQSPAPVYTSQPRTPVTVQGHVIEEPSAAHEPVISLHPSQDIVADKMRAGFAPEVPVQTALDLPSGISNDKSTNNSTKNSTVFVDDVENFVQNVDNSMVPDHKIVGEALKTYIIVECGEQLILIDKHAAHERMNFDRLKAQTREIPAQTLLIPATIRLPGADAAVLEENLELLSELGFEIDIFGENDFIVRTVPSDMDAADASAAVEEICEKLKNGNTPDPAAARDEILHTVACKAAIKAGWVTEPAELERIACEVLSGRVKYCPHGRPVSIVVTRNDLDKLFKRIV